MSNPKDLQEPQPDFETAMRELEELVERLEQGELPFERGVMLTRTCQAALKEAEQKVEILLKKAGEPVIEDFTADEAKTERP